MPVCSHRVQRSRWKILLDHSLTWDKVFHWSQTRLAASKPWQFSCLCFPQCWACRLATMPVLWRLCMWTRGLMTSQQALLPAEPCRQAHTTDFWVQEKDSCSNPQFRRVSSEWWSCHWQRDCGHQWDNTEGDVCEARKPSIQGSSHHLWRQTRGQLHISQRRRVRIWRGSLESAFISCPCISSLCQLLFARRLEKSQCIMGLSSKCVGAKSWEAKYCRIPVFFSTFCKMESIALADSGLVSVTGEVCRREAISWRERAKLQKM